MLTKKTSGEWEFDFCQGRDKIAEFVKAGQPARSLGGGLEDDLRRDEICVNSVLLI